MTLLSGFLGAGKTTLLKNILEGSQHMRVAVIVNDMSSLNIDSRLLKNANLLQVEDRLVEMQNGETLRSVLETSFEKKKKKKGCICCTLREDLLVEIRKLAEEGKFEYIIIESTGISEPLQVAETFTFVNDAEEGGSPLSTWARLDTCVTMVDVAHFFDHVDSVKSVQETGENAGPDDLRTVAQLLVDQIEFADVIVLNKCDLATEEQIARVEHAVRSLNGGAEILRSVRSAVGLDKVLNTGRFSMEKAAEHAGWLKELRGTHIPETEEYGISSFVYSRNRPFHPLRLYALTGRETPLPNVIRSKGFVWLGNHLDVQGVWASAGRMYSLEPDVEWEEDEEPGQTIVIIGIKLDVELVTSLLDACLATDEEMEAQEWLQQEDPYEEFSAAEEDEEGEGEEEGEGKGKDDAGKDSMEPVSKQHKHHHHHHTK